MIIPPFPAQDLAKLVLGYLAEEQLMTAYDEFLQASPYLDACGNEYDRIFMTSLKSILAEYRAVKIYVETCKPIHLKRKLLQCSSLLEMVKYLIQNVDVNKILTKEQNQSKCSVEKQTVQDNLDCEKCRSLKFETCSCNAKSSTTSPSKDHYEESAVESSVETTLLADLPGNHETERKKTSRVSDSTTSDLNSINSVRLPNSNIPSEKVVVSNSISTNVRSIASQSSALRSQISSVSYSAPLQKQNEEFLNRVSCLNQKITKVDKQPLLIDAYKNFASGVSGESSETIIVPDTNTSEKVYIQLPVPPEIRPSNKKDVPKMKRTRTQYLLKAANANNSAPTNEVVTLTTTNSYVVPEPKRKTEDSKVKILSDVKVENSLHNNDGLLKMPAVLKNATSTPLLQMQTIVINGTSAYKKNPHDNLLNFTKDEIMAMPTIILTPASGHPPHSVCTISSTEPPPMISYSSKPRSLGPLTVDVCTEPLNKDNKYNKAPEGPAVNNDKVTTDENLPKTFDVTSASAPKDNTITGTTESSTPQALPLMRKSSSTPRRTSHVRVLDFTTPRRILHESINKCVTTSNRNDVEVVSNPTEMIHPESVICIDEKDSVCDSSKENGMKCKKVLGKITNWDADLRALAVVAEGSEAASHSSKLPPKSRSKKKKEVKNDNVSQGKDKNSKKRKSAKKYIPEPEEEVVIKNKMSIPVKPTINIISGDYGKSPVPKSDKNQNKSNDDQNKPNEDNINDTPEIERMSLQNEIGAKLNISDLLETPYKQALYDIQMETPRFLGPDLPDEPMSDIKIMNIPTPKFLSIPTPSSYSSRPTDYSSGGSYYKPDDQDYMRISDDLICPVTSSVNKETVKSDTSNNKESEYSDNNENSKSKATNTRPVRQCTKNVSYFRSSNLNKTKETVDSDMTDSSYCESTIDKETKSTKSTKENKTKTQNKSVTKVSIKKQKTPKKEVAKSFMKIKPRRPTPSKKEVSKRKRKTPESSKSQARKKITKQEGGKVGSTPVICPAATKSRRKSSTPRKLHCTKSFNSESSGHDSPDLIAKAKDSIPKSNTVSTHDSDTEQLPLRWSDDGSEDVKSKETEVDAINDCEDITKIQEYLKTAAKDDDMSKEGYVFHLVKRGFDMETAKILERDLLDASPHNTQDFAVENDLVIIAPNAEPVNCEPEAKTDVAVLDKTLESDCSTSNNLQIVQDDDDEEEIFVLEFAVHECNGDTENFFSYCHDETEDFPKKELIKLRDNFTVELWSFQEFSVKLRANKLSFLFEQEPDDALLNYDKQETEMAVRSISNMDKLYTPLKQSLKDQCYEIFDSTLTSLDTPLKPRSPKLREEVTVTEIVLEVENLEERQKGDTKKRKRAQSGNLSDENESKKAKPEAQYLLNSANIQNIDIESVLSKLHGP